MSLITWSTFVSNTFKGQFDSIKRLKNVIGTNRTRIVRLMIELVIHRDTVL